MAMYNYGYEKLSDAMHLLTGAGSQKERLLLAVVTCLIHIDSEKDLPEAIRNDFRTFRRKMTSVPARGNEGTVKAAIDTLNRNRIGQAIEEVILFYRTVCFYYGASFIRVSESPVKAVAATNTEDDDLIDYSYPGFIDELFGSDEEDKGQKE